MASWFGGGGTCRMSSTSQLCGCFDRLARLLPRKLTYQPQTSHRWITNQTDHFKHTIRATRMQFSSTFLSKKHTREMLKPLRTAHTSLLWSLLFKWRLREATKAIGVRYGVSHRVPALPISNYLLPFGWHRFVSYHFFLSLFFLITLSPRDFYFLML